MQHSRDGIALGDTPDGPSKEKAAAGALANPVLFLLPGIGGEDRLWAPYEGHEVREVALVNYLDWPDLVKEGWDFTQMIAHLKRQIEERAPTGPICLAGYSIGGPLGYACALAFQAEGRPVQGLAILDGSANLHQLRRSVQARLRSRVMKLRSFRFRAGAASFLAKVLVKEKAKPLLRRGSRFRDVKLPFQFDYYLHRKLRMQLLMMTFRPWWQTVAQPAPALKAPTFLFRSEEHEAFERNDLGWGDYCANVKVIEIAGSHHSMLDPEHYAPLRVELMKVMGMPPEAADPANALSGQHFRL